MVEKLSSNDERQLKMATYTLQRLIREPAFTAEFLRRGGLQELVNIVHALSSGNTLAYALTCCQNLVETNETGCEGLDGDFIAKVVRILVSQERINVCRPATAILKKLVISSQDSKTIPSTPATITPVTPYSASSQHGFGVVYEKINREPAFLTTLVHRLSSPDATLCLYSLSLLNGLMRNVTEPLFDDFTTELENLGTSKAVARLMESHRSEEISSCILEYQNNVVRVLHRRLRSAVTASDKRHVAALTFIWRQAKITEEIIQPPPREDQNTHMSPNLSGRRLAPSTVKNKWRRLGFANENVAKDFLSTGWLGLECCEAYVRADADGYAETILEQINRPPGKRCPWGRASVEVVEILADHWDISSGYTTATKFMPFLLSFNRVHQLALKFFLRMWTDCGAGSATAGSVSSAEGDFPRVSAMVRSQVKEALADESNKTWADVETSFLQSEYRSVRQRQMKELQVEDDFASRASIRGLRQRLYRESYEFVRQQRIQCLLEGAWFRATLGPDGNGERSQGRPRGGSIGSRRNTVTQGSSNLAAAASTSTHPWRFYRLSPNKRYLHYCEAVERHDGVRSGLDDLPERLDLSQVTDIAASSPTTQAQQDEESSSTMAGSASSFSSRSFSLLRSPDVSLADLYAPTSWQYSEWVDGLSMLLRGEAATVNTQETAEYIQALTDIAVKIKLLDVTGEKLDIPDGQMTVPDLPSSLNFFFAEL